MNILLVSSKFPPEYSGSGLRAYNTYKRLSAKFNFGFKVLASSITSNKSETYEFDGVKVIKIANKISMLSPAGTKMDLFRRIVRAFVFRLNYIREALPAFRYLYANRKKYDLIHVFGNVAVTSAAISFARIFKKPFIVELVNETSNPHQYEPLILRLLTGKRFPQSSTIVCISERQKRVCSSYGYHNNLWCRPNPVNEKTYFVERQEKYKLRHKHSKFRDDDTLLVNISKYIPRKNQIFLIDVMRYLPDNFKLLIAGPVVTEGPLYESDKAYLDSIRFKTKEYGLDERVRIETGFIENVDEFIKMADVYLFPTKEEGLGTPMLESIACGVPVVASNIPGITDSWIKDGKSGYISELEPEIFAEKIQAACRIPEETLDKEAEEILSAASTEIIDGEYYRRIRGMVKTN